MDEYERLASDVSSGWLVEYLCDDVAHGNDAIPLVAQLLLSAAHLHVNVKTHNPVFHEN